MSGPLHPSELVKSMDGIYECVLCKRECWVVAGETSEFAGQCTKCISYQENGYLEIYGWKELN